MPKRNPRWNRDEILLALDLYFDPERGPIDSSNPKIVRLSQILNKLPFKSNATQIEKYRNPNGVTLKLSNFLAIDPDHAGKGMEGYSKLDQDLFNEYSNRKHELHAISEKIVQILSNDKLLSQINNINDDEDITAKEGDVIYRWHKLRERDRKIVEKKKALAMKRYGKLECEVCSFDFQKAYGELGAGFMECHHTTPLHLLGNVTETRLEDLALVCSNCHRMLHKKLDVTFEELKSTMNQLMAL